MKNTDRKEFIQRCIDDPDKASTEVVIILSKLNNTKKISQRVDAVAELLHLSPSTIWRDYVE